VVSAADPLRSLISVFQTGAATFLPSSSSFILTRAEWTPFQTHCYSENVVAPGIEPGTSGYAAGKLAPKFATKFPFANAVGTCSGKMLTCTEHTAYIYDLCDIIIM
jgi:hypothetical protein